VRLLLDHSADINQAENNGSTPLIWASYWGHIQVLDVLLNAGANLEHASKEGQTALLRGVAEYQSAAVQFLLNRGADFTKVDNAGQTALSIARERGYEAIVGLLENTVARRKSQGETEQVSEPALADADEDGEITGSMFRSDQFAVQQELAEETATSKV
jgi:ankyrin repeat protein